MARTTRRTGDRFASASRRSRPSTRRVKPAIRQVFGRSSQFKGIGVGVRGDVRK